MNGKTTTDTELKARLDSLRREVNELVGAGEDRDTKIGKGRQSAPPQRGDEQPVADLGRRAPKVEISEPAATASGKKKIFEDLVNEFFHLVYVLAARQENPAIFYDNQSNSLASPKMSGGYDVGEEQRALKAINQVGISSGDTVKEINRLLDHTSAKRIAEEMDIVTYHSNAARLFIRIKTEFTDTLKRFDGDQKFAKDMLALTEMFDLMSKPPRPDDSGPAVPAEALLPAPVGATYPGSSDKGTPPPSQGGAVDLIVDARRFLARYDEFLNYAKRYATRVGREFYTEASIDAYKEATRPHALRIEKQGLFASFWTIAMGVAAGLAVAAVLIFYDNNAVLKNWTIAVAALAAAIAYFMSVKFGQTARDRIMSELRGTLYDSLLEKTSEQPRASPPVPVVQGIAARIRNWNFVEWLLGTIRRTFLLSKDYLMIGGVLENYFKFERIEWKLFENKIDEFTNSQTSLAKNFTEINKIRFPMMESRTFLKNCALLFVIIFIPTTLSYFSNTLGRDRSFAFISQTDDLGSCVIGQGRLLLAIGGSYFIETDDSTPVTEIAKSRVLRIEPIDQLPQDDANKLDRCDKSRPVVADQTAALVGAANTLAGNVKDGLGAVAGKLGTNSDTGSNVSQDGLAAATNTLAENVKNGLDAVAGKLGSDTEQVVPVSTLAGAAQILTDTVKTGLQDVAKAAGSSGTPGSGPATPIVVPIIIQAPPTPVAPATGTSGPSIITYFVTADGKVHDFSGGVMVLPIFQDPVTAGKDGRWGPYGIDTVEKAFYFGLTSLDNSGSPDNANKRKLLHEYAAGYIDCMKRTKAAFDKAGNSAGTPRLTLRVEGYASEKWEGTLKEDLKPNLNLYLAEGRRIAAIKALGIDDPLIDIVSKPDPAVLTINNWRQVRSDEVHKSFLFNDYKMMTDGLASRLPRLGEDKTAQIEALAHAVAITADGEVPELCRPLAKSG